MRRSLSLRLRLAILVAGTILPLIGFAAALLVMMSRNPQRVASISPVAIGIDTAAAIFALFGSESG